MGWFWNGTCKSKARLDGKVAIITGANTGIGKLTALDFIQRGARVIMACRDVAKGEEAAKEISQTLITGHSKQEETSFGVPIVKQLDLASFASVRTFCDEILQEEQALHLLINNAGVMLLPKQLTEDGFEIHFATNHLGHFLLTHLLMPLILKSTPARIVNVSSKMHIINGSMKFDDINMDRNYSPFLAYGRSKLANILFTKELARRLEGRGVTVYSLHPGVINTELSRHMDSSMFPGMRRIYHAVGNWMMKTPLQGAQTTIYCAVEESLANESGLYYDDCKVTNPSSTALDPELAKQLWEKSLEYVHLTEPII